MLKTMKAAAVVAAAAVAVPLAATAAHAAPISRTTTCGKFTGNYTYWSIGGGWYHYSLTGTITRTCGSGEMGVWVTGDENSRDGFYAVTRSYNLNAGESVWISLGTNSSSPGVKNLRIALI